MTFVIPPVAQPSVEVVGRDERFPVHRIYCVGRNYAKHARQMGMDPDREPPFFFSKRADAVVANGTPVPYPPRTSNLHHELELVEAIGTGGSDILLQGAGERGCSGLAPPVPESPDLPIAIRRGVAANENAKGKVQKAKRLGTVEEEQASAGNRPFAPCAMRLALRRAGGPMKAIVDLCVVPLGVGVSVSEYDVACERVVKEAGLKSQLHSYGTNIEGEWDAVFAAVKRCHEVVHEMGVPRITTTIKLGARTDRGQSMDEKVRTTARPATGT